MKREHALIFVGCLIPVAVVFFGVTGWFWKYHPSYSDYFIRCLAAFATVSAICFALFKDYILGWIFPVTLKVEFLGPEEANQHIDQIQSDGNVLRLYCHHLRVKNLTKYIAVNNCRMWLKQVTIKHNGDRGQPDEHIVFAVPQLMEWAPSEIDRDKRTFGQEQIVDLGQTIHSTFEQNRGGQLDWFMFTIDRKQGAAKELLEKHVKKFGDGATLECEIFATADNYHARKIFRVCILVKRIQEYPGKPAQASVVTVVDK